MRRGSSSRIVKVALVFLLSEFVSGLGFGVKRRRPPPFFPPRAFGGFFCVLMVECGGDRGSNYRNIAHRDSHDALNRRRGTVARAGFAVFARVLEGRFQCLHEIILFILVSILCITATAQIYYTDTQASAPFERQNVLICRTNSIVLMGSSTIVPGMYQVLYIVPT